MKTGDVFTVERCVTGYIVIAGPPLGVSAEYPGLLDSRFTPNEVRKSLTRYVHGFGSKEQVLSFLRAALTRDGETGLAKEAPKK